MCTTHSRSGVLMLGSQHPRKPPGDRFDLMWWPESTILGSLELDPPAWFLNAILLQIDPHEGHYSLLEVHSIYHVSRQCLEIEPKPGIQYRLAEHVAHSHGPWYVIHSDEEIGENCSQMWRWLKVIRFHEIRNLKGFVLFIQPSRGNST